MSSGRTRTRRKQNAIGAVHGPPSFVLNASCCYPRAAEGNLSRGGWLAAGIVLAFVLAPSAAIATAAGVTEVTGPGGQRAAVTDAGQLTTGLPQRAA
jgi:hypothetical protein